MNSIFIQQPVFTAIMSGQCNRIRVAVKDTDEPSCPYGKKGDPLWVYNERSAGFAKIVNIGMEPTHDRKNWMWAIDIEA